MKKRKLRAYLADSYNECSALRQQIVDADKRLTFLSHESAKRELFLKEVTTLISNIRSTVVLNPASIKLTLKAICDKYQYPL